MQEKEKQSVSYLRFMKDRYWRNYIRLKSELEKTLSDLSQKAEEELSKKDLLLLISSCCDYMRSYNLYKTYRELVQSALVSNQVS